MPFATVSIPVDLSTQIDDAAVATNALDLYTVPDAPKSPSASGNVGSITVEWSAPDSNGGSDITGYHVYCSTTGSPSTSDTPTATTDASTTSTQITGLTRGTHEACVVTAVNAAGQSAPSDSVHAGATGVPGRPIGVYTFVYNETIAVNWSRPVVRGGTRITHYSVYCASTGPATVDPSDLCATVGGNKRQAIIRHLTNGVSYSIVVVAQNAVGSSKPSAEVVATPSRRPTAPRSVQVTPVVGGLSLSWKSPKNDFGIPVQAYFALCATSPSLIDNVSTSTDADTLHAELDGLTSGTQYYCAVVALNDVGQVSRPSLVVTATPL
jgi:titin